MERFDRKIFLQQLENKSANAMKIQKIISESSAVCVRIKSITKIAVPLLKPYHNMPKRVVSVLKPNVIISSVLFTGKIKYLINGASDCTEIIDVLRCKFKKCLKEKYSFYFACEF